MEGRAGLGIGNTSKKEGTPPLKAKWRGQQRECVQGVCVCGGVSPAEHSCGGSQQHQEGQGPGTSEGVGLKMLVLVFR